MSHRTSANGLRRGCMSRIVVSFDDETFEQVKSQALANNRSFAEQVRLLVEWGLEVAVEVRK